MLTEPQRHPATAPRDNRLGNYLRARREQLKPADVGLPAYGRRRVPGLRREELALLAGVSATYYIRLEQGHSHNPSSQLLKALAHARQLDEDAECHLQALARPAAKGQAFQSADAEQIRQELGTMLQHHLDVPAFVLGRSMDVLAANAVAGALHPSFVTGRHILHDVFLDETAQAGYHDLAHVQRNATASLRAAAGALPDDARIHDLVKELADQSAVFRRLWALHEVRNKIAGTKHFNHPALGEFKLDYESFTVIGTDRQQLIIYHADPASEQADALERLLASIGPLGSLNPHLRGSVKGGVGAFGRPGLKGANSVLEERHA